MIPPRILLAGDRRKAVHWIRRARVELDILRQAMAFQGLQQGRRRVVATGVEIVCQILFGQGAITIYAPPAGAPVQPDLVEQEICWCSNCFAEGTVLRVIGDYGDVGSYATAYPACCNTDSTIKDYIGIRYEVAICQRLVMATFVCAPSDFAEYAPGERVAVLFAGRWSAAAPYTRSGSRCGYNEPCVEDRYRECLPCNHANRRPGRGTDEIDGTFTLLPLSVLGVTA